ncbi:MAG TPA: OmpA family protein [Deltaproteobacteria bacterium]|nr:OmpA family protein [Deltaproteobacteria bacterium]
MQPPRSWILLAAAIPTSPALAADVDLFEPAGSLASGQGSLQGESPVLGDEGLSGGILGGFARDAVVRRGATGDPQPAVSSLAPVYLQGSWTSDDLFRFDVLLPVYAWVDAPLTGFSGPTLGDLRLQGSFPLWSADSGAAAFALVPRIGIPTAAASTLVTRGMSAGLVAAAGGRMGSLGWVADAGVSLAGNDPLEDTSVGLGSVVQLVGGGWWHASDTLRFGLETDLGLGLARTEAGANQSGTVHGFAQATLPSGLGATAGLGTGTLAGIGTPRYRLFAALTWASVLHDRDADGLVDDVDGCPDEAEDLDGFEDADGCLDADNDADTIADTSDACPDEAEDRDGFEDADGCPDPDNDADTVADVDDACPDEGGPAALGGCPDQDADGLIDRDDACPILAGLALYDGCPDRDEDGVPDPRDACPDEPRPAAEDPETSDGCPKTVYVTAEELKIEERIAFLTGKHTLHPASYPLLDKIRDVLQANNHVARLEIQGHTDNVGPADYNLRLSQRRADSVRAYLIEQGIAPGRLVSQGYGERAPLFTNRTETGRMKNRRVQFKILEQTPILADSTEEEGGQRP